MADAPSARSTNQVQQSSTAQPIPTDRHRSASFHTLRTSTTALPACAWLIGLYAGVVVSLGMIHTLCKSMTGVSMSLGVCVRTIR